ncbi:LysR family transcriptional regulator [Azomonas macrocytogenes]|uniref:DNA-binding transcriptional LysR family regulator n=1 Tax=Azomonas macrocytogenes TaxID=69962 RepID=A0A839T0P9_AZOMA|nr:LysR family transcriptional regulator [Azomonas macrocytogenes]MBB3103121.1 DNA-binding transcriptional LysR family regulator [Azomonas macrocytogenes]
MDFRDLTYFETIAELGHVGKAAEKLNRSQPALTKSIQRLEESLGTRLFQRDGRGIRLTAAGELLLARGRQLSQNVAEIQREIRDFASGAVGNVRLGCAASMAEYLLPQLTAALLQRTPDVTLSLVIGQDDLLKESLCAGRLDMIICPMIASDPRLTSHSILEDEMIIVASRQHPVFQRPLRLEELCQYRWILPGSAVSARRWVDNLFLSRQLPTPFVQIETNSISLLPRLIALTNLLSFIARETLECGQGMARLREVPLDEATLTRTIGVSTRAGGYLSPAAQAMLQLLKENGKSFFSKA